MKKLIVFLTLLSLVLAMVGCGKTPIEPGEMRDVSTKDLIAEMGAGWNLGNTMDADGDETAWGNPKTTKAMIDEVHNAGFNVLRIPTTWDKHMGSAPDYTIDKKWLERVEEIIGYAFANDMFVILNTHHETNWIVPTNDGVEKCKDQFEKLWTQIAEYFKDYGDHLLFEGLNEPRVIGSKYEWMGGSAENRQCVNQLNDIFIKTVRATGGNNETRTLLITTVAAQPAVQGIENLTIPADKHVAVSIHAYTPYQFTYNLKDDPQNTATYTATEKKAIKYLFDCLNDTFISNGVPVIITECGCESQYVDDMKTKTNEEEIAKWVEDYYEMAKNLGIPCVWWDNGYHYRNEGNELFAIFNRKDLTWYDPIIVETIMKTIK